MRQGIPIDPGGADRSEAPTRRVDEPFRMNATESEEANERRQEAHDRDNSLPRRSTSPFPSPPVAERGHKLSVADFDAHG